MASVIPWDDFFIGGANGSRALRPDGARSLFGFATDEVVRTKVARDPSLEQSRWRREKSKPFGIDQPRLVISVAEHEGESWEIGDRIVHRPGPISVREIASEDRRRERPRHVAKKPETLRMSSRFLSAKNVLSCCQFGQIHSGTAPMRWQPGTDQPAR